MRVERSRSETSSSQLRNQFRVGNNHISPREIKIVKDAENENQNLLLELRSDKFYQDTSAVN